MSDENGPRPSAFWRSKAEEARTRCEVMHDPIAVQTMVQVVQLYERMARRAAEREERPVA
jgi:hypothetical protein